MNGRDYAKKRKYIGAKDLKSDGLIGVMIIRVFSMRIWFNRDKETKLLDCRMKLGSECREMMRLLVSEHFGDLFKSTPGRRIDHTLLRLYWQKGQMI